MSSTKTRVMSSSSVDLTAYRKKLTTISVLSKDEITALQSYDAEQMLLEKKMKDEKVKNDTRKKRAASCTYNKITKSDVDYRRHSVSRTSVLDRKERRLGLRRQITSVGEPSVSGLSSSTDDEAAAEEVKSDNLPQNLSTEKSATVSPISHRDLELQSNSIPMSRRRLSIPKRSYSPEPLKRTRRN
uniref:Uncharacterized protein n=1 Tax=Syphacia muris TaxID=451379 RepID=A0A0N5ANQ6_9BILA